jgi:hypothetical protein
MPRIHRLEESESAQQGILRAHEHRAGELANELLSRTVPDIVSNVYGPHADGYCSPPVYHVADLSSITHWTVDSRRRIGRKRWEFGDLAPLNVACRAIHERTIHDGTLAVLQEKFRTEAEE